MGGRTSTTLASNWNNQPTKIIRVPVVFADDIMEYARDLDKENKGTTGRLIDEFVEIKRKQSLRLHKRFFTMDSPNWIIFNEFRRWLEYRKRI